jgi:hypothetical protein
MASNFQRLEIFEGGDKPEVAAVFVPVQWKGVAITNYCVII